CKQNMNRHDYKQIPGLVEYEQIQIAKKYTADNATRNREPAKFVMHKPK
ncbi:unnamed protein product, partial [marine sediment metagenome]